MDPIVLAFEVACPPEQAFRVWTHHGPNWWPPSHSVSTDPGLEVVFEPHAGGRIYERTPDGTEHDWGEILTWEPPGHLVYLWHLVVDRRDATEVELTFTASGPGTVVRLEHRGWERLGAVAAERRSRNRSGWAGVIPLYEAACGAA